MSNRNFSWDPNTLSETLDMLSYENSYMIRMYTATHSNTTPDNLERLSYDENPNIRYWVAHNSNTPQYIKDLHKFKEFLKYYDIT